jgi:hypothetical protein
MTVDWAEALEHEIILYCKEIRTKVVQAIAVVFKKYHKDNGVEM